MIHPFDEDALRLATGLNELPKEVCDEYELWINCYHRTGGSGQLGAVGCVALVRLLGIKPPQLKQSQSAIDWREVPDDGSARVEALFFGGWQPGTFLGFVDAGTLAVRLDGEDVVKECRPDIVRLAPDQSQPATEGETDEDDGILIDLTDDDDDLDVAEVEKEVIQNEEAASSSA